MIIDIDDKLLSSDLFTEYFCCDYAICAGVCCVHGDSGAPLDEKEKEIITKNLAEILPYLKPEGRRVINEQGVAVIDIEGDLVTPLINGEECAYSIYDDDYNCLCGIERAYFDKKIDFRKPVSCHLYPIRIKNVADTTMLNYDQWSICQCARDKGENEQIKVYEFLKEPLIRQFGEEFYKKLEEIDKLVNDNNNK
ncbi:MAG: DUF3109 family protein [Prevotellaceae bacterium]|jgi:hypothetical protein|nr:DUF3109 family protein [Prevotellaceae bacterium]